MGNSLRWSSSRKRRKGAGSVVRGLGLEFLEPRLPLSGTPQVIELRVATGADDAEEAESGAMYLDETSLA